MTAERSDYVNIEELQAQVTLEQAAAFYGVALPELHSTGQEIRTRCFLNCGRTEETGDRAMAIRSDSSVKKWRCHQYGCGKGGNLVSMCGLMKFGPECDRPRGQQFKAIRDDLRAMAAGAVSPAAASATEPAAATADEQVSVNLPLAQSPNERARGLITLDEKFLVEPGPEMNKAAAAYFRQRPFLTPDVCRKWRIGYLPRDVGGEKAGGTMRGRIVYGYQSPDGQILTWFGRDPQFEEKHGKWVAAGRQGREPTKVHFVKGFHRGLELFGQHNLHADRVEQDDREKISSFGLIVVEGPNDVIRLDTLGIPAVGLCSNTITTEQAKRVANLAHELGDGTVTLMLDCDSEGENGMKQALPALAKHCRVRLGWSREMYDGRFSGRQPESLTPDDWEHLRTTIAL